MRALHVPNFYQSPGGEGPDFGAMLEDFGYEMIRFTLRNDVIPGIGRPTAAGKAVWNRAVHREPRRLIGTRRPDIGRATTARGESFVTGVFRVEA